uniref:Uncharacterized protein AlNc14C55G4207 n=1 Tax=Albugo laibachii Nc14 TaxID=890382 RepID=F0WC20_9STRA|nr:conserved hypothetical protein [Albugo laibachii Nc14]|eukprot:CCA18701.1 conserved hypothetical protein [Albugo laibachii Nc14]
MTLRDCLTECCTGSALFIFNGVDLICGIILLVYSLYIGLNHYAAEWLYVPICILGSFLLITVGLSWFGTFNPKYSVLLPCSSNLFLFLAIMEFAFAIIIFTQGTAINQFLREHQQELKLSDKQLQRIEDSKFVPAYLLLGLFVMEIVRFGCSARLFYSRKDRLFRYRRLGALDELEVELMEAAKEEEITKKYTNLRVDYQQKYASKSKPSIMPVQIPETLEYMV